MMKMGFESTGSFAFGAAVTSAGLVFAAALTGAGLSGLRRRAIV